MRLSIYHIVFITQFTRLYTSEPLKSIVIDFPEYHQKQPLCPRPRTTWTASQRVILKPHEKIIRSSLNNILPDEVKIIIYRYMDPEEEQNIKPQYSQELYAQFQERVRFSLIHIGLSLTNIVVGTLQIYYATQEENDAINPTSVQIGFGATGTICSTLGLLSLCYSAGTDRRAMRKGIWWDTCNIGTTLSTILGGSLVPLLKTVTPSGLSGTCAVITAPIITLRNCRELLRLYRG